MQRGAMETETASRGGHVVRKKRTPGPERGGPGVAWGPRGPHHPGRRQARLPRRKGATPFGCPRGFVSLPQWGREVGGGTGRGARTHAHARARERGAGVRSPAAPGGRDQLGRVGGGRGRGPQQTMSLRRTPIAGRGPDPPSAPLSLPRRWKLAPLGWGQERGCGALGRGRLQGSGGESIC